MPRGVNCSECHAEVLVPDDFSGKAIVCPHCAGRQDSQRDQSISSEANETTEPEPADSALAESAELETYSLVRPNEVSAPRKQRRPRSDEDGNDDRKAKPASRKRKRQRTGVFAQDSWVSTVVGFVLIGLVLSVGFWYVQRERDRPLREVPRPSAASTPPAAISPAIASARPADASAGMFQHKSTLKLASPAADLAVGGAGQFIAVFCADQRRLDVIDVERGEVSFTVPALKDSVLFAAGRSKLFVFHRDRQVIERWNLRTKEREVEFPTQNVFSLTSVALGSDSEGPLLVRATEVPGQSAGWYFLDAASLEMEPVRAETKESKVRIVAFSTSETLQVRAAANGSAFCAWRIGGSSTALEVLTVNDGRVESNLSLFHFFFAALSFDGQFLNTDRGLFRQPFDLALPAREYASKCFPSADSQYYLGQTPTGEWHLRATGVEAILGELPKLVVQEDLSPRHRQTSQRMFDKRLTFVSKLGRLVFLSQLNDSLVFYDVDVNRVLPLTAPRLTITSRPPSSVRKGEPFAYQIETIGSSSPLTYQLDVTPDGMTVSPTGKLTWDVPSDFAESEATIVLTIRSAQGAEDVQAIVLPVQ